MAISTADFKKRHVHHVQQQDVHHHRFQHVKPGKGGAFVRMKLRDIKTGRVLSDTVNAGVKFDTVRLEQREMTYLYNDGSDFYFMDPNSYEQFSLPTDHVGEPLSGLRKTTPLRWSMLTAN